MVRTATKARHAGDGHRPVGFFALRSPLLPFDEVFEPEPGPTLRARLPLLLKAPEVREALFLASPELEGRLDGWLAAADSHAGGAPQPVGADDIALSLARYLSRMATRPTPFGLFAAHATGVVATGIGQAGGSPHVTRLELPPLAAYRRHSRPDCHLLHAVLRDATSGGLAAEQQVIVNQSAYRVEGRLRFVEASFDNERYRHSLTSLAIDDRLQAVLDRFAASESGAPLTAADLWLAVEDATEADADEAEAYVDALLAAQALVPTAGIQITGAEPVDPLIDACDRSAGGEELGRRLRALRDGLGRLDDEGAGCDPERYRSLADAFGPIGEPPAPVKLATLCQVDLAAPGDGLELSPRVARRLADAAALAWRLRRPHRHPDLDRFRDDLRARHEHEWVSLTDAIDPDRGVGFGGARSHEPLLRDLVFPTAPTAGAWTAADAHLLRLLTAAIADHDHDHDQDHDQGRGIEIELTDADIERLAGDADQEPSPLPDTFTVGATLVAPDPETLDRGDGEVLLTMVTGPSGAELLGRFAHGDPDLERGIRELIAGEEALDPDAIHAELVHLPDPRGANVVLRPVLREWELPYLGLSGAPPERQLRADDLEVAVRGDGLVLRSRTLGRRVIPRLSSAHNHSTFGAPLYRFLGALATDDRDAAWTWGPLEDAPFLPRVRHGSVVLARARWRVGADEVGGKRGVATADLDDLRSRRRLPRFVVLREGDNRLLLDLDDELGAGNLRRALRAADEVRLEELYPGPGDLPLTREGRALTHEILLPFITTRTGPGPDASTPGPEVSISGGRDGEARPSTDRSPTAVPRTFLPGSEWLYVKLYGGARRADHLIGQLDDLVAPFLAQGIAQRWFFIRYADPDEHVRLRIGGDPAALTAHVLPAVTAWAAARQGTGELTRMTIDTYDRETDRYGGPAGIEPAEAIFEQDSRSVSVLLADAESASMDKRWLLTLLGLRDLLVDLGFDSAERLRIAQRCKQAFAAEHRADTGLTKAIGAHFRTHRSAIDQLMAGDAAGAPEARALAVFAARRLELGPWSDRLRDLERDGLLLEPRLDLAASFLHMHANRMLVTRARAQELVLYDHLERVERAAAAR